MTAVELESPDSESLGKWYKNQKEGQLSLLSRDMRRGGYSVGEVGRVMENLLGHTDLSRANIFGLQLVRRVLGVGVRGRNV